MKINLTLIQKKIGHTSIDEGIKYLENIIDLISIEENSILLLPELWFSGFNRNKLYYFSNQSKQIIERLQMLCKRFNLNIAGTTSNPINEKSHKLYNEFIFISSKGQILSRYRKIHLFPLTLEKDYFLSGDAPTILNFHGTKIGFAICYDLRFPELFRYYATNDVEIILIAACFPKPKLQDWKILLQARAIENQIFISAVNAVGSETIDTEEINYFGHSMLINPCGNILTELNGNEEIKTILVDTLDIFHAKEKINYLHDIKAWK